MLYVSSSSEDNDSTVETQLLRWHHAPIKLVTQKRFMLRGVHCSPPYFKTSSYAYVTVYNNV